MKKHSNVQDTKGYTALLRRLALILVIGFTIVVVQLKILIVS